MVGGYKVHTPTQLYMYVIIGSTVYIIIYNICVGNAILYIMLYIDINTVNFRHAYLMTTALQYWHLPRNCMQRTVQRSVFINYIQYGIWLQISRTTAVF